MDLNLTEDQRLIVDSAVTFLAEASPTASVRATSEQGDGFDRALWQSMVELGWCGVTLSEDAGGLALGWVELALLQEQLGRHLACVPFFDSAVLATATLQGLGDHATAQALLAQLAQGERIMTLALPHPGTPVAANTHTEGTQWVLNGRWPQVGSAQFAQSVLLPATDSQGQWVLLHVPCDHPGLSLTAVPAVDGTRRFADVQAQNVTLPADACLLQGEAVSTLLEHVRKLAAIALAAEQVGVAQQALDLTLAYTLERQQFEKPIASFQAVKHRCAQMNVAIETARSAVYGAACMADTQPDETRLQFYAAQARVEATQAALYCTRESIQLHGGVGFTWEYDPHLYFRRAQASSQRLGAVSWWLEQVATDLLDRSEERA